MKASGEPIEETLFERLMALTHLPYVASCVLLTLALGIPGTLLARYLDSQDLSATFAIAGIATGSEQYWRAIAFYWIIAYLAFFFYLFYFVRYLRLRIVVARAQLSPLLAGGEEAYNRVFRNVTSKGGALVTFLLVLASFAPGVYRLLLNSLGPISAAHVAISQGILDFAAGTGIWLFFSSVWSLLRLAKEPMKPRPSSEDPLYGLAPIGSIALAMALVFFGAVGLRGLGILASGVEITPLAITLAFDLALMIFGLVALLLAIHAFHRKMVEQKELERFRICGLRTAHQNSAEKLLLIDIMERRLEKSHTWPFDKDVLSHITAIVLSVTAIMIARIIVVAVKL